MLYSQRKDGYRIRAFRKDGRVQTALEHVEVAERALGKPLPAGAKVHHVDENRSNNHPSNLVICPSEAYHQLLHRRIRALEECGNADWRKCAICRQYDSPDNMKERDTGSGSVKYRHPACHAEDSRRRRLNKKLASDPR